MMERSTKWILKTEQVIQLINAVLYYFKFEKLFVDTLGLVFLFHVKIKRILNFFH